MVMTMSRIDVNIPDVIGKGYGKFWRFTGRYRVVKGSRASKKSKTIALWIILKMMKMPLANTLCVRKVGNTLRDSCWADLKWAARRLKVYDKWRFTTSPLQAVYKETGQKILFRGLDDPEKTGSISVDVGGIIWMWIEEAHEIDSEEDFDKIDDTIRGSILDEDGNPLPDTYFKQVTLSFNPWSSSHWLKRKFFDVEDPDILAITTNYMCNEWLDESDLKRFERMKENQPARYKVAGLGEWGIEGASFFEEYRDDPAHYKDRQWTHVIAPFEPPSSWRIYRGFDFGYAKPFSVGWWAVDPENRLYRILELYGCTNVPNTGLKWEPDEIFREIKRIEKEHKWLKGKHITGIADPSIWDSSRGISIAEMGEKLGVYFEPGDNTRIPGWMQMHYRMRFDENGYPMMYIFSSCKSFMRVIPLLTYSETRPEDLDTDLEDHIADESRYVCMARPYTPPEKEKPKRKEYNPLDTDDDYKSLDRYDFYRIG